MMGSCSFQLPSVLHTMTIYGAHWQLQPEARHWPITLLFAMHAKLNNFFIMVRTSLEETNHGNFTF